MEAHWPVLIIDPSRDAADYIRYALVDGGQDARRVQWAASLGAARVHLRRGTPRVIVSALPLPDSTAAEVLDTLRQEAPDVPIVGVTRGPPPVDMGSQRGGAHAWLRRAKVPSQLVEQVRVAIQRCRFERQLRAEQAADVESRQAVMIGRIAQIVSEELGLSLASTTDTLEQLRPELAGSDKLPALQRAQAALLRSQRAVDGLMTAAGQRVPLPLATHLPTLLQEELPRLRRAAGPAVEVEVSIPAELPDVAVDPSVLALALALLTERVRTAIEGTGTLIVQADHLEELGCVELRLLDDGPPLQASQLASLPEVSRVRTLLEQVGSSLEVSPRWPTGGQVCLRLPEA